MIKRLWDLVLLGTSENGQSPYWILQKTQISANSFHVSHPLQKLKYMHFRLKLARPDVTYDVISRSHNNQLSDSFPSQMLLLRFREYSIPPTESSPLAYFCIFLYLQRDLDLLLQTLDFLVNTSETLGIQQETGSSGSTLRITETLLKSTVILQLMEVTFTSILINENQSIYCISSSKLCQYFNK